MEHGTQTGTSRLFVAIALLLSMTLVLGVLGIAGLVFVRFFAGPSEVAMPPPVVEPTGVPIRPDTPTPAPLHSATPTPVVTATLVIPAATAAPLVEGPESGPDQDGPGMASPSLESSDMPETGLGPLGIVGTALALTCLLGGARIARRMWAHGRA